MEERNLDYFFGNSISRDLCKEFILLWRKCKTKEDLFNLSLKQDSIPYISTSIFNKWGCSIDYIKNEFSDYINGKYIGIGIDNIHNFEKLESSMYIDFIDDILKKSNIIHLCKCNCKLTIPLITIGNTYISNSSNVELYLHDYSFPIIYLYDDSKIKIMSDTENCNVTIYKYSDECSVNFEKTSGKYKIERKELKI